MTDDSNVAETSTNSSSAVSWIKLACGITSGVCFGYGIRAAYKQARPFKPNEISHTQMLSGVGFASRALTIATILTCSGYALFVIALSAALDIDSPKQFGKKVKGIFGNTLRIPGSEISQKFEDVFKES